MEILKGKEAEYQEYVAKNSSDGYSKGVVVYGEQWANLMEKALSEGKKLEDIAKQTSHDADTEGITGFMYGCAVSALAKFWVHGESLRLWHNLKTQIGKEGEKANESGSILNSALLNIG